MKKRSLDERLMACYSLICCEVIRDEARLWSHTECRYLKHCSQFRQRFSSYCKLRYDVVINHTK